MADQAKSSQVDDPRDACEKRVSDSVQVLFEILNRPSRQNVLYAKDKRELKELAHQIMSELSFDNLNSKMKQQRAQTGESHQTSQRSEQSTKPEFQG